MSLPLTPRNQNQTNRHTATIAAGIFIFLCSIYMLTYSGTFPTTDETAMMAAAESLAKRGEISANPLYWNRNGPTLTDSSGDSIGNFEPLQPLLGAPLYWIGLQWARVGNIHLALLLNVFVTALAAAVVFLLVLELGYAEGVGLACALIFGLGTIAFPYSKQFFREPLAGLLMLVALWCLTRLAQRRNVSYALGFMLALGASYATKEANLIAVPAFGLVFLASLHALPNRRLQWQAIGLAALPLCLLIVGAVVFFLLNGNSSLFGGRYVGALSYIFALHPFPTEGLLGYLVSPGKSFFLYTPIALATLWAMPFFWRAHRREALLCGALMVSYIFGFAYTKEGFWWGGLGWGPRFLVPLAAFAAVPLAPLIEYLWQHGPRWQRAAFSAVLALSLYVQAVGVFLDIRTYSDAVEQIEPQAMWTLALWDPLYSPPFWSLRLLDASHWNFSWARYLADGRSIDWPVLLLCLAFVAASGFILWRMLARTTHFARHSARVAWTGSLLGAALVASLIMLAIYDDPRYPGGADIHALVDTLAAQGQRQDVMVLNNHTLVLTFMNYSKSPMNWYALTKETELSASARALLGRLIKQYARVWLSLDHGPTILAPHTLENYLTARAYPVRRDVFSDYAQLDLFSTVQLPDPQNPMRINGARLTDQIALVGFDLSSTVGFNSFPRGSFMQLSLLWQATQPIEQDYTVFVQLLNGSGAVVWQSDQQPVAGSRPTSGWQSAELVRDNYGFVIDPTWPVGSYHMIAGMYQWPSLARLPVSAPNQTVGDYVDLTTINIQ